jgi:hypothetical protein
MKVLLGVALALLLQQPPSPQQSAARTTAAAAIDAASDPADCVKALKAFDAARRQEIRTGMGFTPAALTQIDEEKTALARACISRFTASSNPAVLPAMADLYTEIGLTDEARTAITAALGASLPPAARAAALASAVNLTLGEPKSLRVVMVTRYWGYFSSPGELERDITRDEEYKRDAEYFAGNHLDVPVAIGDLITTRLVRGAVTYSPGPDPNETAYKVSAFPQIHLIDKKGRIRLIMVGYDDANEPKLAEIVTRLLAEN